MTRRRQPRNIATEFDAYFGSGDLEDWQRLCRDVGLTGQFRSKTECRKTPSSKGVYPTGSAAPDNSLTTP
ncbi:hypothetical protein VTJ04DRAFT_998 [Mycothermus thermophilus]|uniref:uncharacterized protein n=1 Tax=Humicola insolens TaxID=85995 RepID=UPI0037448513